MQAGGAEEEGTEQQQQMKILVDIVRQSTGQNGRAQQVVGQWLA